MRAKITAIFLIFFGVFVGALVYRVDQLFYADKLSWSEAQSRSQMSAVVHGLEVDLNSLQTMLTLSFSELESNQSSLTDQPFERFEMMAKILPPNSAEGKTDWQMVTAFFRNQSEVQKWAQSYATLALKTIKPTEIKKGSSGVFTILDPARKPFILMVTHGPGNWYAALMKPQVFQKLMDRQKGLKSELFLVNRQGQTLGHITAEYVGSLLSEDPMVKEIVQAATTTGGGVFKNLKGERVQGFYEQIGNSNFYAVITTPMKELLKGREDLKMQLILLGGGLCLIGLAIFFVAYKPEKENEILRPSAAPQAIAPAPVVTAPAMTSSSRPISSLPANGGASVQEKMQAYKTVASSLSHELKNPLTSILGHTQLAKTQGEGSLKEHLAKIEEEAREARDLIQKLLVFTGEDKSKTTRTSLQSVLTRSLKAVEGRMTTKGIRLNKDLKDVPEFDMATDQMSRAIENVLVNAIEAMERAPQKNLGVKLWSEGKEVFLEIQDSGEGISPQNLEKIFDPFFTTRSGQHVGLGLSTSLGIVRAFHGDIRVKSEVGKGTTIEIKFSPLEVTQAPEAPAKVPSVTIPKANQPFSDELTQDIHAKTIEESVPEHTVALDPILIDESVESMIDEDPLADKKVSEIQEEALPPAPADEFSDEKTVDIGTFQKQGFTSKVDKPKIEFKKKAGRAEQFQVQVRRPGDRV